MGFDAAYTDYMKSHLEGETFFENEQYLEAIHCFGKAMHIARSLMGDALFAQFARSLMGDALFAVAHCYRQMALENDSEHYTRRAVHFYEKAVIGNPTLSEHSRSFADIQDIRSLLRQCPCTCSD